MGEGVLGLIAGSFGLTILTLSVGSETISKDVLMIVLLHRKFPSTHRFKQQCAGTNVAPTIHLYAGNEYKFSFQFSVQAIGSKQYANLVCDHDALSFSDEASLWTVQWESTTTSICPSNMKYRYRSSDSGKYIIASMQGGGYEVSGKELSADDGYWWCVEPSSREHSEDNTVIISSADHVAIVTLNSLSFWFRYCDRPIRQVTSSRRKMQFEPRKLVGMNLCLK